MLQIFQRLQGVGVGQGPCLALPLSSACSLCQPDCADYRKSQRPSSYRNNRNIYVVVSTRGTRTGILVQSHSRSQHYSSSNPAIEQQSNYHTASRLCLGAVWCTVYSHSSTMQYTQRNNNAMYKSTYYTFHQMNAQLTPVSRAYRQT